MNVQQPVPAPWKNPYRYQRRSTREVKVGKIGVGGNNPIRVQSMLTSDTMDTVECVKQTLDLVAVGCEIVRITAQTKRHAANLENIIGELRSQGCDVPIVADIHFKPDAAMEAAKWVDKVRVNPGNYVDKKKFQTREYTDEEYADEVKRIEEEFVPLVELCKERGVAMRIGTNHGSLSDRIMNRYGDTPLGMVESALEFARIARAHDYHNFLFSMKASNPKVMIEAYRLLVSHLVAAGADWNYPIHLGVTEAGDGEDGRIKSAIGIGSLLEDGIGDTIRVSLTEDSVHEIPVAEAIAAHYNNLQEQLTDDITSEVSFDPFDYRRRATEPVDVLGIQVGGNEVMRVATGQARYDLLKDRLAALGDFQPEIVYEDAKVIEIDPMDDEAVARVNALNGPALVAVADNVSLPAIPAYRLLAARIDERHPILLKDTLTMEKAVGGADDVLTVLLRAATRIGALICDGIGDAILVRSEPGAGAALRLSYNILQGSGARIFKTDYVACPSCGRTLFDLQSTTQKIREATGHLKGVRIAVMGCIVNGPGEMADADFGYVGGAPNKINLYVGKTAVKFNIPEAEAVDRLIDLINEHGKWVDPPEKLAMVED